MQWLELAKNGVFRLRAESRSPTARRHTLRHSPTATPAGRRRPPARPRPHGHCPEVLSATGEGRVAFLDAVIAALDDDISGGSEVQVTADVIV
jgi:hypothetical protein